MKLSKLHSREGREEFNKLVDDIHVELVSYKLYGERDKLKKPKTLKNTKQTWIAKIIGRSASFFEMSDEIFIKMGELFSISQTHENFYHLEEYGSDFYSAYYYRFCDAIVNHYYHQLLNN